jgi:hypothetical protein
LSIVWFAYRFQEVRAVRYPFVYALAAIALSTSASAEPVRVTQAIPGLLPAGEVVAIVRSAGFVPLSPIVRRGDGYVLRASAPDGREMRVIVGGRSGEILSAVPVVAAGPGGERRLGAYERMDGPPGYVPPPIMHDNDRPMARPQAAVPNAPSRAAVPEARDYLPPSSAEPPAIMREERGEHGLLPPPPDRFPSRAVAPQPAPAERPAAKPAPVKRAAAPPLPKPRPATEANASADDTAGPPPAASAPAPSAPAPAAAAPVSPKVDPRSLPH